MTWSRLYVYGGYDINEGTLDSLWMFDMGKVQSEMEKHVQQNMIDE